MTKWQQLQKLQKQYLPRKTIWAIKTYSGGKKKSAKALQIWKKKKVEITRKHKKVSDIIQQKIEQEQQWKVWQEQIEAISSEKQSRE